MFPISNEEDFKDELQKFKDLHPSCNHHCYAFRLGINGEQYRFSDDGEPNNSAGKPIFGQLLSSEITNVGAIVARYFGGTKLGVGGLIHAYKEATKLAIEANEIILTELKSNYSFEYSYDSTSFVNQMCSKFDLEIVESSYEVTCKMTIKCKNSLKEDFEKFCLDNNLSITHH